MEPAMALKLQIKTIVIRAIAVSALLTAAALAYCLIGSGVCSISTFFITADLQGRHFYRLGKYEAAAKRFAGLQWQAASFYRAGDFKQAAAFYSGMSSAEGAFNHGNALVMLGKYEAAVTFLPQKEWLSCPRSPSRGGTLKRKNCSEPFWRP
jgi:hypothetical protein